VRNLAVLVVKVGGWLLMLALLWTATPNVTRAADGVPGNPEGQVICGGVFGLRDWTAWRSGWGSHDDPCDIEESCVRGVLELRLPFTPQGTGLISADTDEHLLSQDIHAGVSLGPRVARVSFWSDGRRVSCRDEAFRDELANLWVIWIVRP
jgi:hypothetical protein